MICSHEINRYDVIKLKDFLSVCSAMLTISMLENVSQRICQNMKNNKVIIKHNYKKLTNIKQVCEGLPSVVSF